MSYLNILFLDIETVGMTATFDELDDRWQSLWERKARYYISNDPSISAEEYYQDKAAIHAEFGRVACISFGYLFGDEKDLQLKIKSFAGHDEKVVLENFGNMLQKHYSDLPKDKLCGHNIKEFDIPYLCRRMIRHNIPLPRPFQLRGKRPWEIKHLLDTMELWKFGDFKNYTSLDLLSAFLDIPTPKDDIDGSKVHETFYHKDGLDRIVTYCEKDVVTTARVYMKMMHQIDINPDNVTVVMK